MLSENIPGTLPNRVSSTNGQDELNWEEQYAYSLGMQAYVYGFPWVYLSWLRWLWTTAGGKALQEKQGLTLPWAPINTFFRSPVLASPSTQTGGSPNTDTLYAVAWLDVRDEPIVVSVPEVTDRYYTLEMACIDSDNFAYVGTHSTGTAAANYLIAGPGWAGEVPTGILDILPRSRTPTILIMGRTQVINNTDEDKNKANAIQQQYQLKPLSSWPDIAVPTRRDLIDPHSIFNPTENTEGTWISMNRAMTENPPGVPPGINQLELLKLFATIGVGPNQSWESQSSATKKGLALAARDGLAMVRKMAKGRGKTVNGWSYPPQDIGRAGQSSDFITRAALQALGGIVANDASEAVYLNSAIDSDGNPLEAGKSYTIKFADKTSFPPFDGTYFGFWSITMYQSSDFNLVPGSEAYSINSYYPEYHSRDSAGGLTIFLQRDKPENYKKDGVYWLQTPEEGEFYLIIRVYVPGPEVSYTQTWQPPLITLRN
ncbi:MAG TPA: DUF1254 domain-containing protein [Pyrinomonadaceae bacterium]|nr:DUF1254 domain-containing protein [Pyrinomonadaceae bacterium]